MKQNGYHELNPLIRARELELLSGETFERLVQAKTIEETGEILRSTHYAYLVHENFDQDFDKNLLTGQTELLNWLVEAAPEKEIVWVYTMRYTFHNLKVLTKAEALGEDLDHLYLPDGFYSLHTLKEAIRSGTSNQLPASVMETILEVKEHISGSNVLQGIDVIYDRQFLKEQRVLGEKLGYPELLDEIICFIDLTNFVTLARGLQQNRGIPFMTTVLSSSGDIPKNTLLGFAERPQTEFIQFMQQSAYGEILAPALQSDKIDYVQMERCKDNYLTEKYVQAQTQAFGPLPLLAFLNAKEVEQKNLRLIITAKVSGIGLPKIRERMREAYGA